MQAPQYFYSAAQGSAALHKGDEARLVTIGKFKTEREALQACEAHYAKACAAARNFDRPEPVAFFL
jgi:hypothetical protein